ncbi:MAG TPA: hypothetical protein VLK89_08360 [Solirubrobacterales bacterium]|nr:hypothetical protein [Solirubrobacterales bacterium]
MPDMPIATDCAECGLPSYAAQEARNQHVVLGFLLEQHPAQLTIPEVAQALYAHPGDFAKSDEVERAIRDLVGGGLLHCHGPFVLPTRAALYFFGLEME